jgi:hypothetical protein
VPDRIPRRRLLIASATTFPLLLATAGCRSAELFAGPDPLAGPPPLAHDTVVLTGAITAELKLISRYKSVISSPSGSSGSAGARALLPSLLAEHEAHLTQLKARLHVPAGTPAARTAFETPPAAPPLGPDPVTDLRTAERQSAATLTRHLATADPALAQLLASIAASDATHDAALGSS